MNGQIDVPVLQGFTALYVYITAAERSGMNGQGNVTISRNKSTVSKYKASCPALSLNIFDLTPGMFGY